MTPRWHACPLPAGIGSCGRILPFSILRHPPGIAGPRVSHPQRVASHANVGTRFNLPLRSFRCGWGQPRSKEACWSAGISPNLTRAICAVGSGDARRYLGESLGTSCCCLAAENSPSPRGRYDYYRRGEINARVAQVAPPLPVLRSCRQRKAENRAGKYARFCLEFAKDRRKIGLSGGTIN